MKEKTKTVVIRSAVPALIVVATATFLNMGDQAEAKEPSVSKIPADKLGLDHYSL